jgi:hypothetical protein
VKKEMKKNPARIVRKNQLTTSAVKRSHHKTDDLDDYFFEFEHLVERGLKFQHETETVLAP